ncbi:MAG TPA: M4 family metallopeptidase [Kofleriaceae bacterium]
MLRAKEYLMMKSINWAVALLALGACASDALDGTSATASRTFHIDRADRADDGVPYFVHGTLGVAAGPIGELGDVDVALSAALPEIGRAIGVPSDQLFAKQLDHDELGMTHVKYAQRAHGLPVIGGDVIVHVAADGTISSVSNGARDASGMPATPQISSSIAADVARAKTSNATSATAPDLVYVITNGEGDLRLAWRTDVRGSMVHDTVYVDAISGEIVARHPHIQPAKSRSIFSGGDVVDESVPSTQVGSEGTAPTDTVARTAYDNTGTTYDCYSTLFARDSFDNAGAELVSYVHITQNGGPFLNAFWDGMEMVYGDGDGSQYGEFVRALDVTAHELTHAVTERSAGLTYQVESGALNEATSDILGATCEAFKAGAVSANTWKVGEDIYTPGTPGDALRYMNNPTLDAPIYNNQYSSTDYYPERLKLPSGAVPDDTNDYGYVHLNSGIPNLAFYLLAQGGTHPRSKTSYSVVGIGIDKASRIWYRALNNYFTSNTTFAQARTATEMAANDLYPGPTKTAVSMAWATVGVGTAPIDNSPPTVAITSPQKGATVQAGFTITATASDDQGVLRVDFSIDGQVVGSAANAPYMITSAPLAAGSHVVVATAYDAVNHASDSAMVTIVDPTCGNTCSDDQVCDMTTGTCIEKDDGGGCCSAGGNNAAGSLVLFFGVALVLRRRRRR